MSKKMKLGYDPDKIIYRDVGDKKNYKAFYPNDDGTETFMCWISKICVKDEDVERQTDKNA